MNPQDSARLQALESRMLAYRHAMDALYVDGATVAPKNAARGRSRTLGTLAALYHELLTAAETRDLLAELAGETADPVFARRVELIREESDELVRIPRQDYETYRALLAEAEAVWHEAKPASDWQAFAPCLEKVVAWQRRLAALKDPDRPAYDVLLDGREKGVDMAMLDPFFRLLREKLTPLILAVGEKPAPADDFLHGGYSIASQRVFSDRLMALLGLNRDDCAIGETEHPFTNGFNKHDVRITTHYHEEDVSASMFSVLHESGHAIYELGVADEFQGTVLAHGASAGLHESQSRFYENLIGRSLPFCGALLPLMRECFPGRLDAVTPEMLYRAVNRVRPSLIRTEADELTYPIHVMIRYELEKAMIGGELSVADVPGEWERLYRTCLGVRVPDHRRGVLQDSHWSSGLIGYFPGYALGSAYGAQMLAEMEKTVPVQRCAAQGDLRPVTAWLGERVHRHGRSLTPAQVLQNALGGDFDPRFYVDYLTRKYSALYGL